MASQEVPGGARLRTPSPTHRDRGSTGGARTVCCAEPSLAPAGGKSPPSSARKPNRKGEPLHPVVHEKFHDILSGADIKNARILEVGGRIDGTSLLIFPELEAAAELYCVNREPLPSD